MTLRTPRRRISPRAKLKYRAVREFFRRALGSTSQQDIKINSSIAVNVTDLKRKIVGLEEQLHKVNKHCRGIACDESCFRKDSETYSQPELKHSIGPITEHTEESTDRRSNGIETQVIYKSSEYNFKKPGIEDFTQQNNDNNVPNDEIINHEYAGQVTKEKIKRKKVHKTPNSKLNKHKARSVYDTMAPVYSTSSFHSLANTRLNHPNASYPCYSNDRKHLKTECVEEVFPQELKDKKYKENIRKNMGDHYKMEYENKPIRMTKHKRHTRHLDQDFIAEIIRRQYRPVKMFGRKESDISQFSVPVCRDQEYSLRENIIEGSELCSCCYDEIEYHNRSKPRRQDLSGMRSVCDARLYSSKKFPRHKHRRMHAEAYSNSDMYDLVPVKERSSPKTRRKFVEDNVIPYQYYREVPPSPRTLRPRLNLQAQYYTELENCMARKHLRKHSPIRQERYQECMKHFETDVMSEDAPFIPNRIRKPKLQKPQTRLNPPAKEMKSSAENAQDNGAIKNLHSCNELNNTTIDTSLNKTQESTADKTDKALCEIKDILQSFLHEIKKENVASQCDKSEVTCKTRDIDNTVMQENNTKMNNNAMPNSASFNSYTGQCGVSPFAAPFTNPCCYPVMPMYSMNCPMSIPNGYIMPSQSYTCTNCVNALKETNSARCCDKNADANCQHTDTDELIKEIYKFVAQEPAKKTVTEKTNGGNHENVDAKLLTSRSVGGSFKNYLHDAKVGTPTLKYYSKSCEAIGSKIMPVEHYNGTNASYSDTLLEKLSLEATQSTSETELDTESTDPDKVKNTSKFSRVLRSFGLFKKKKKDVIEEVSESESVIDVEVKPKRPPFKQEITNYMMHDQEYYHRPPVNRPYQKPRDYSPSPRENLRPREYSPRPLEYSPRRDEYPHRPHRSHSPPYGYSPPQNDHPSPRGCQPRPYEVQQRPHEYQREYHPPYNPAVRGYPSPHPHDQNAQRHPRNNTHYSSRSDPLRQRPSAPPYSSSYDTSYSHMQPPFCLKEIEVKSTGTQSERKMSIFRKFKNKMQQPVVMSPMARGDEYQRNFSTQTPQIVNKPMMFTKPQSNFTKPLFNWKSLQAKAMQGMPKDTDPLAYSLKTQKELAAGDLKMRNAMLKKLFYKRNPFSPRNLIVRTLLGKDKSSYGEPQTVFRPRMFL